MDHNRFDVLLRSLTQSPSRRQALHLLAGSALGSLLTVEAGVTLAKKGGKGKSKKGKVQVCHQGQTITVSKSALKGHLKHGDISGACPTANTQGANDPGANDPGTNLICSDGIKNGGESDVDCGGTCPRCATGKTCASRNDCASARCDAGTCKTCEDPNTDCGTDANGSMCACRDHESGQRFCTKINGRLLPAGTPCTACQGGEQCFPINGGAGGIECILPCGA